ncbi:MAG TPA: hypothetical protein VGR16_08405 [Thermomicrobiales bacterium]|nr:hypothetical protein [Thermomicrobiales bacterium]
MAKFQRRRGRDVPKSKRIRNNPNVTQGRKVAAFEGGVIVSKQNPDGSVSRYAIDEYGRRTLLDEEAHHHAHR